MIHDVFKEAAQTHNKLMIQTAVVPIQERFLSDSWLMVCLNFEPCWAQSSEQCAPLEARVAHLCRATLPIETGYYPDYWANCPEASHFIFISFHSHLT